MALHLADHRRHVTPVAIIHECGRRTIAFRHRVRIDEKNPDGVANGSNSLYGSQVLPSTARTKQGGYISRPSRYSAPFALSVPNPPSLFNVLYLLELRARIHDVQDVQQRAISARGLRSLSEFVSAS